MHPQSLVPNLAFRRLRHLVDHAEYPQILNVPPSPHASGEGGTFMHIRHESTPRCTVQELKAASGYSNTHTVQSKLKALDAA